MSYREPLSKLHKSITHKFANYMHVQVRAPAYNQL